MMKLKETKREVKKKQGNNDNKVKEKQSSKFKKNRTTMMKNLKKAECKI